MTENIIQTPIKQEIEQSLLDYGMSIITDRAIPSAEDGLKPVNRRILYDMFDKGYFHNKKFVKSAQAVGDTMGRFHPHGDSSIYGALAWMSQPWNMRYPLVEWHGNNGSRDGDEPAASRYTECRLSKIGEEMLSDLKKNTIDWQNSYTDEEQEPIYLPGKIPNLIVNGTSGIAWAMACSFAPHNLKEILAAANYLLDNPDCKTEKLLDFIQGPDFPTGGLLINKDELKTAYLTGKGRARVRGEYTIESSSKGSSIVFSSIPYKVSKEKLIVEIDKLCEDGVLSGIKEIRDETNYEGVRFVIDLEKNASVSTILAKLFKNTQLEDTYSFNQVALVDKKPKLLNIKQLLENYILHQRDVLLRATQFDINKISKRINVLEGLLIALANIDEIIKLIKNASSAEQAKIKLIEKYLLNEEQAKAILDMKLSKLAKLEASQIQEEKNVLDVKLNQLNKILENPVPELHILFNRLSNEYGDNRRTVISQIESISKEEKQIEFVEPEKCVVVMSQDGLIKRIPSENFKQQNRKTKGSNNKGNSADVIIRTNTVDNLLIFTDKGKMYKILVDKIPIGTNSSIGHSIKNLVNIETAEKPILIYSIYRNNTFKKLFFVTKKGFAKQVNLSEFNTSSNRKNGIIATKLQDDDELVSVTLIDDSDDILFISKQGMILKCHINQFPTQGKISVGVKSIALSENDCVLTALPIRNPIDKLAIFTKNGLGVQFPITDIAVRNRNAKGVAGYKANHDEIVSAALISDEDMILISGTKSNLCLSAKDIPLQSRCTKGNLLISDQNIISISKI